MAERIDIEDFFEEIDPDMLKYASAFLKCGFSSSVTMKYWCEQDFQNLEVVYLCAVERFIRYLPSESPHFGNPWTEEYLV